MRFVSRAEIGIGEVRTAQLQSGGDAFQEKYRTAWCSSNARRPRSPLGSLGAAIYVTRIVTLGNSDS